MADRLEGAVVVTGGARGIGRAIAEALAGRYARIVLMDRDRAAGEATAAALGERASFVPLDVREAAGVAGAFAAAAAAVGPLAALVNNAGAFPSKPFLELDEGEWDAVLDTNLKGCFLAAQAFARHRRAAGGGGAIVNIASTAAFSARVGAAPYSASKAGIVMLTRSLAQELGPSGLRVNAVAPGLVEVAERPVDPAYRDAFVSMIPLGRIGRPADVARVVRFLLSDEAAFVTGACVPVDGGFLAGRALPQLRRP